MTRMDPWHHPPWIWNNHQRQWQLWRSHGNTLPTKRFVFQNYNYATFIYHSTKPKKRSGKTGGWGEENIHRDGGIRITTGIVSISKCTPSRILFTSSMTAHSVLSCTKPGNKIPYPPTDITTTRDTREPDPHWRWWWRTQWMKRQLLHCGVNLFYASLLPLTLSRMQWSMTSILQMSTIHMRSLLSMSSGTLSIWLSGKTLKPVTSTIVGDVVTNSFFDTCLPCFFIPFFIYDLHAFTTRQPCLLHMFTLFYLMFHRCSPQG